MEGMNRRVSSDTYEDFHISKFIMNRKLLVVVLPISASHLKDFGASLPS